MLVVRPFREWVEDLQAGPTEPCSLPVAIVKPYPLRRRSDRAVFDRHQPSRLFELMLLLCPAARTGSILASVFRADVALALRKAFQSPPAR